jgi:hypothetical protein
LILELLEPDAEDSLASWGYFDAIFEEKESAEDYILEKLAEEMLQKDSRLREEFQAKLASDPGFEADSNARLRFFFERSPYRDERKDCYPVVRFTTALQLPVHE